MLFDCRRCRTTAAPALTNHPKPADFEGHPIYFNNWLSYGIRAYALLHGNGLKMNNIVSASENHWSFNHFCHNASAWIPCARTSRDAAMITFKWHFQFCLCLGWREPSPDDVTHGLRNIHIGACPTLAPNGDAFYSSQTHKRTQIQNRI